MFVLPLILFKKMFNQEIKKSYKSLYSFEIERKEEKNMGKIEKAMHLLGIIGGIGTGLWISEHFGEDAPITGVSILIIAVVLILILLFARGK